MSSDARQVAVPVGIVSSPAAARSLSTPPETPIPLADTSRESGSGSSELWSEASLRTTVTVRAQTPARAAYLSAKRSRPRAQSDDSGGSFDQQLHLSRSPSSGAGWFSLPGDAAAVAYTVVPERRTPCTPRQPSPSPSQAICVMKPKSTLTTVSPVFPAQGVDRGDPVMLMAAAAPPSQPEEQAPRVRTWSASIRIPISVASAVAITRCASPVFMRDDPCRHPSCLARVTGAPSPNGFSGSKSSAESMTTTTICPSTDDTKRGGRHPHQPPIPTASVGLATESPSLAAVLSASHGSFSLARPSTTNKDEPMSQPSWMPESGASHSGGGEPGTPADITRTPPHLAISGFYSGPAYQCLADALDQSCGDTDFVDSDGDHHRQQQCVADPSAPLHSRPDAHHTASSRRRSLRASKSDSILRRSRHQCSGLEGRGDWATQEAGPSAPHHRRRPLIEVLSYCSSSSGDDEDSEGARAEREDIRAQRSASDQAAFAARYKQFLRQHVANSTKAHGCRGSGGARRSRVTVALGQDGEGCLLAQPHGAIACALPAKYGVSSPRGLSLTDDSLPGLPRRVEPWKLPSTGALTPSPQTPWTASLNAGQPMATPSVSSPGRHSLHLARFGGRAPHDDVRSTVSATGCLQARPCAIDRGVSRADNGMGSDRANEAPGPAERASAFPSYTDGQNSMVWWSENGSIRSALHGACEVGSPLPTAEAPSQLCRSDDPLAGSFTGMRDVRTCHGAIAAGLLRPVSLSFVVADFEHRNGGSTTALTHAFEPESLSCVRASRSLQSRSHTVRPRRVSGASNFTMSGAELSQCSEVW